MALIRVLFLLVLWCAGAAAVAQPVRADHVEAELVAGKDAFVPGQPTTVALRLKHDPHWHTYWQVPGDSGLPTRLQWQLPQGWQASAIEWPVPQRLPIGPLMNYGYEGETFLLMQLTPPAGARAGELAQLQARADWLVCREVCIPGGADLKLSLPLRTEAGPGRWADALAAAQARVPKPRELGAMAATIDGTRIKFAFAETPPVRTLEFFPLEEARLEAAAPQRLRQEGATTALYLTAAAPVAPEFRQLRGVLVANGGPDQGGWAATVAAPLAAGTVPVVADAAPAAGVSITLAAALLGALLGGLLLNLMPCVFPVLSLKLLSLVQHDRADTAAHRPHAALRVHGLVYAAGVVASFVALAAALLALRLGGAQLGWGFQLQTPAVVVVLAGLFFLIGLNLLGTFEWTIGTRLANTAAAERVQHATPLRASFGTGVLAVVVAAPCTAPFMGAALGYAITQPAPLALAVFAALGIGMALPYVLLTFFPALLARLPRPGAWMERFKQAMAFPMFGTAVWLLWVLAQQRGIDAAALVLGALVLVGFAAWAFGLAQRGAQRFRWAAALAALVAVYVGGSAAVGEAPATPANAAASRDSAAWQPWSPEQQQALLAQGKPVFVDFTAAWCVTCQANKRLVLNAERVEQAFADHGVVRLRADWTQRDDAITRELARFQRNGVPLYVLYDGKGQARVLPELLTERLVLDALAAVN